MKVMWLIWLKKKALALPLFMKLKIIRTKNCPLRFFFFFFSIHKCWLCLYGIIACYNTHCFLLKILFCNFRETKTDEILKNMSHCLGDELLLFNIITTRPLLTPSTSNSVVLSAFQVLQVILSITSLWMDGK